MTEVKLKAMPRTGKSRQLRSRGMVPAVVYGKGKNGEPVELNSRELDNILHQQGKNVLINLVLSGKKSQNKHVVMLKELQQDPISRKILHVDLCKISLRDKIHTTVPLHLAGESPGVTQGGILQQGLRELEIECLPAKIPEELAVDISGLSIGGHLTVADLPEHPDYRILSDSSAILVTVVAPRMAEQPETTDAAGPVVAPDAVKPKTSEEPAKAPNTF